MLNFENIGEKFYIDDKAIRFKDWNSTLCEISIDKKSQYE